MPALAETFREYGFEGASLATLTKATGLGKGSLYNFFPGGKEEMMEAVLADIDHWFTEKIFLPLEQVQDPAEAISSMIDDVTAYFRSGRRVCLVGCLGLNASGAAFAITTRKYFARWISALSHCLEVGNVSPDLARQLAEEAVSGIQGAIVLARALDDDTVFHRVLCRQHSTLMETITS
ncbi:TetR/AcrR family transcriptional regulator [Pseudorhodobacter turbinis]|uniref:TetR/AcrR family transcriptional regulator n=1 Tax=Pseudorhodobacter turbinis TaxID=2500533 RepID=UPI0023F293CD|nr:TetR/AcrR family transcriptional regulator [Pseudorhodobacter turbinis]